MAFDCNVNKQIISTTIFPSSPSLPMGTYLPTDALFTIFANMAPREIAEKRRVSCAWNQLLTPVNIRSILIMQFNQAALAIKNCLKDYACPEQKMALTEFLAALTFDTSNHSAFKESLRANRDRLASILSQLPPQALEEISRLRLPPGYENTVIKLNCWIRTEANYMISNPSYLELYQDMTGSVVGEEGGVFIPVSMAAADGWRSGNLASPRRTVTYGNSQVPTYLFEDKLKDLKTGDKFTLKLKGGSVLLATCSDDPISGDKFQNVISIKVNQLAKQWAREDLTQSLGAAIRRSRGV